MLIGILRLILINSLIINLKFNFFYNKIQEVKDSNLFLINIMYFCFLPNIILFALPSSPLLYFVFTIFTIYFYLIK
jgi:hypothetical protein